MVAHLHGVQGVAGSNPAVPTNLEKGLYVDYTLLEILACPLCKGKLAYNEKTMELICAFDKLAYPIRDDVPVMLEDHARQLSLSEYEEL